MTRVGVIIANDNCGPMFTECPAAVGGQAVPAARLLLVIPGARGHGSGLFRFLVLARNRTERDVLDVETSSIGDIPALGELMTPFGAACPAGRDVADRILTDATDAFVTSCDVELIRASVHRTPPTPLVAGHAVAREERR